MTDNASKPAPSARLAELACQAVDILIPVADGAEKITYGDLADHLGGLDPHTGLPPVLRYLHWHGVVPLGLPMLTAVVVRADTRRPGKPAWDLY